MSGDVRVGLDVGGTFTDLVCWDGGTGRFTLRKVPTTPADIAAGILQALAATLPPGAPVAEVAHGTTVATNALLERKGARVGLLTTAGFRDLLELRDGGRRRPLGWQGAHVPLVPRALRREVPERISAAGAILTPLDGEAVEREVRALLKAGVEAVAVAFLNAHRNPVHEEEASARLRGCWPTVPAVRSSALTGAAGEFTRTCTAVLSAYLHPLLNRYVRSLVDGLAGRAEGAVFRFIDSAAGSLPPETAAARPLLTLFSGPAGGVTAASALARLTGAQALVSCDMGGTSFDVAVIRRGAPDLAAERDLEFGLRVALAAVEVSSAAAGGEEFPIRFLRFALREDSAGPGQYRGGAGAVLSFTLTEGRAEGHAVVAGAARGLRGGVRGRAGRLLLETPSRGEQVWEGPAAMGLSLAAGDRLTLEGPGGAGWGIPYQRSIMRVEEDVAAGLVSRQAARRQYGVVFDTAGAKDDVLTYRLRKYLLNTLAIEDVVAGETLLD